MREGEESQVLAGWVVDGRGVCGFWYESKICESTVKKEEYNFLTTIPMI